jgi:hypothetical protein
MSFEAVVLPGYQARLVEIQASVAHLRLGQMLAFAILCAAIAAILLLGFLAFTRRSVLLPYAILPLPALVYSGREVRRRKSALLKNMRLERYYQRGIARLEGRWAGTGASGEEFKREEHPYEHGLHLFGESSLFQLLCTCRTEIGRRTLAGYLLDPPDLQEITERQAAVQELHSRADLRERIGLLGEFDFEESRWETFVDWLESPRFPVHPALRIAAVITAGALGMLLLLGFDSVFPWSRLIVWIAPLLAAHSLAGLFYRSRVLDSLRALRSMGLELGVLAQGLKLLRSERFQSPRLQRIVACVAQDNAPLAVRRLERLIHALNERDKEWFYAVSRALLIGTQLFLSIEKWKAQHGASLARWLSAWGEFEALVALSGYSYEHPENSAPNFLEDKTAFEGSGLAHPLLPAKVCIRNDVNLNDKTKFYIVSGSNMSGKSTLIRTVGLNAILAYAGAPVCATDLRLSLFSIHPSLAVVDSLRDGKSKFLAEMDRLRQALDATLESRPVLFLIDEILSGTNSGDRRVAAEAIVRTLVERGAIGIVSTHDLALTKLASVEELGGANVHMGSRDSSDPMNFDYILKPGITTESNALAIARLAGVPV